MDEQNQDNNQTSAQPLNQQVITPQITNPTTATAQTQITQPTNQPEIKSNSVNDKLFDFGFRAGLALLLLTNGIVAFIDPDSFKSLLEKNVVAKQLPDLMLDMMVTFAGINDLILSIFVIIGKWRKYIFLWVGAWFAVIAIVKIMNLIWA